MISFLLVLIHYSISYLYERVKTIIYNCIETWTKQNQNNNNRSNISQSINRSKCLNFWQRVTKEVTMKSYKAKVFTILSLKNSNKLWNKRKNSRGWYSKWSRKGRPVSEKLIRTDKKICCGTIWNLKCKYWRIRPIPWSAANINLSPVTVSWNKWETSEIFKLKNTKKHCHTFKKRKFILKEPKEKLSKKTDKLTDWWSNTLS